MRLPKTGPKNASELPAYLEKVFQKYLDEVDHLSGDPIGMRIYSHRAKIETAGKKIVSCVKNYFGGHAYEAYLELERMLDSYLSRFVNKMITSKDIKDSLKIIYRMRSVQNYYHLSNQEMFHVPFEMRHKLSSQRYSISGVPALYCGGSLLVCWEELKRPSFDTLHFSRIEAAQEIHLLNFGNTPKQLSYNISPMTSALDFYEAYAVLWPLIAACSIKPTLEGQFTAEYIIPNLLMQWVLRNKKCDGVRYFSVQVPLEYYNFRTKPAYLCNYAFPAKNIAESGFCTQLMWKFKISEPLNWRMATMSQLTPALSENQHEPILIGKSQPVLYSTTDFWRLETYINSLKTELLF
jgi:hypothetical protein